MFFVELNDGQIKFECDDFLYVPSNRGVVLEFRFIFDKIPYIIYTHFENACINRIKNAKVYGKKLSEYKKYLPTYEDIHVESITKDLHGTVVIMIASRINFRVKSLKKRLCSKKNCDYIISEITVMPQLIHYVGAETAENIWNSKDVIFYCCTCYHYVLNHLLLNVYS